MRARVVAILMSMVAPIGACSTTNMTAQDVPMPVMVGPVACIGCPASPPPGGAPGPRITDASHHWRGTFAGPGGDSDMGNDKPPQLGMKVAQIVPDPCRNDIRVSEIRATSFGVMAFIVVSSTVRVQVDAVPVPVANGSCPPWSPNPGAPPGAFPGAPPGAFPGANPAGAP